MARAGSPTPRPPDPDRCGGVAGSSGTARRQPYSGVAPPRLPYAPVRPRERSYADVARSSIGGLLRPNQSGSRQGGSRGGCSAAVCSHSEAQAGAGGGASSLPMEGVRNRAQWERLRESSYSLFIDNIPVGKDAKWLRAIFSKGGRVMDVFIPSRWRRGSNTRFGFVRYRSRVEAIDAARRWNGLWVGNGRLEVKLADNGGKPSQDSWGKQASDNARKWRPKQVEARVDGGRVAENSSAHIKRHMISLDVVPENELWLKLCVVGELKEHVSVEQLKEELRNHDIGFYKVFPMAGQRMMINFSTQEEMDKCLSENYPLVLKRFSKLHQWQEDAMPKSRLIWMSVTGLPFKAWSESNYAKLAAPFGRYLRMDDRSKQFTGLDRARFLVETTLIGSLSKTIEAEIGGKVYQLGVFEDCFLSGCETEGFLRDETSEEQEKISSTTGDNIEIMSKRQEDDERVAETQSVNVVGAGNGSTKLSPGAIEITNKRVPVGGQVKGYEVDELEENQSEDDSVMSLEKIQNRLKVLRRKTAKDKEVVKYKRRMGRRCEKSQLAASVSCPRAQDVGTRQEEQNKVQEGGIEGVPKSREAEMEREPHSNSSEKESIEEERMRIKEDEEERMRIKRKEAERVYKFVLSLGIEGSGTHEENIQAFMDL